MSPAVRLKLSVMMFLQFAIWGCWSVPLGIYLNTVGFDGVAIGNAYSTTNWGAIFAPIMLGMVADRFFSAQKVMGVLHGAGALLLWYVSGISEPGAFFWALLVYALAYMPTLALANAVCFGQMNNPGEEFPGIRVLGTVGWIVMGLMVGTIIPAITGGSIQDTNTPLKLAALLSLVLGVYAFFLPDTPPKNTGHRPGFAEVLGLDTLSLMKNRSFAVFIIGSLLISIPLAFYYNFASAFLDETGMEAATSKMTLGQISETLFLFLIPFFFVRLGVKKMLLIGMAAWAVRYVLFAFGNTDSLVFMLYLGIILHGVCYDFFFVTGQIYVDKSAPAAMRASAQGFIHVITYGVGMVIGARISGLIVDRHVVAGGHDWQAIWLWPAGMALGVLILFQLLFRETGTESRPTTTPAPPDEPPA